MRKRCKKSKNLQASLKKIERSLDKMSGAGIIGEPTLVNGEKAYRVGPEHVEKMTYILEHPEHWPDTWTDAQKREAYSIRDEAIRRGLITK